MEYAVQYTISVLEGAYAQKYSVVIYDAARLEGFLKAAGSPLAGLAADAERRDYDGYDCFQSLMKLLKKEGKRSFCTSIVRTHDGVEERGSSFTDEDDAGAFTVEAYGFSGICRRGVENASFETMTGKQGVYRAELTTVLAVFKDELMNLLNLCEEAMAKDGRLIARTVPMSTPKPAPLFQL